VSEEAAPALPRGLSRKDLRYFILRRLHSLTGVLPIGGFLIEHFYSNYQAVGAGGEARFNEVVKDLQGNPVILFLEIGMIALPILYHAFYGLFITTEARMNGSRYRYGANWRYNAQRITGAILLLYITYHVFKTRLAPVVDPSAFTDSHGLITFKYMHAYLVEPLLGVPTWAFYVVGTLAACFHFANGLWGFLIHWGITVGPKAQRISLYACAGLGIILAFLGLNSLAAFVVAR
jgi:succinate dehydrogenase / fumarate reductase cytochrome b subunit